VRSCLILCKPRASRLDLPPRCRHVRGGNSTPLHAGQIRDYLDGLLGRVVYGFARARCRSRQSGRTRTA
jgi:hypothetical protein